VHNPFLTHELIASLGKKRNGAWEKKQSMLNKTTSSLFSGV
jgi:hypothetical protein